MTATNGLSLSDREMQVVRLLPYGLSDEQIAARLGITRDTVKSHLRRINRRLGTTGRVQLVVTAYESGVLRLRCADTELAELRVTVGELAELLGIAHCPDGLTREALVTELRERIAAADAAPAAPWTCAEGGDHRG